MGSMVLPYHSRLAASTTTRSKILCHNGLLGYQQ
jgi:hypothetical protein